MPRSQDPRAGAGKNQPGTASVSAALTPLVSILTAEQSVYQELLQVADEERSAIVDARLPALKQAVERKQEVLVRLAELEERRVGWAKRWARKHSVDLESLSISGIMAASSPEDRRVLQKLQRQLARRVNQLIEMDKATRSLLEVIVASIDTSLRYLLADDDAGQMYAARGGLQSAAYTTRQLLDCRA